MVGCALLHDADLPYKGDTLVVSNESRRREHRRIMANFPIARKLTASFSWRVAGRRFSFSHPMQRSISSRRR
jgi:hypothetical protein